MMNLIVLSLRAYLNASNSKEHVLQARNQIDHARDGLVGIRGDSKEYIFSKYRGYYGIAPGS